MDDPNAIESPAEPTVPLALLAHTVNNALVPSRHHLERLLQALDAVGQYDEERRRVQSALTGVKTVLEFVEEQVHAARRGGQAA